MELSKLIEPFPPEMIRQREGRGGKKLDYLETHSVITRLNEAFAGDWSFEILEYRILDNEVVVHGKLTAAGQTKSQFGGSDISRYQNSDKPVSISDDLKSAGSDALKKCATLFGVGLQLYEERKPQASHKSGRGKKSASGNSKPAASGNGKNGTPAAERNAAPAHQSGANGVSAAQCKEILRLGAELGSDEPSTREWVETNYGVKLEKMPYGQASGVIADLHKKMAEKEA